MANVIKSSTTIQPNTIATYPFVIGVNQGGYGPTSSTYYYNGKTPNVGGYVVYKDNGISSPPFYVMKNNTDLVEFVASIGGGYSSINDALNYMRNSGTYTCVNLDYPNIVTSGLILNLDAGYVASYPRGYTTWSDMSGNYNTGNLINGLTYSSDGGGCLVFDGVDDYVSSNSSSFILTTNVTINVWVKHLPGGTSDYGNYVSKGANDGYRFRRNGPSGSPLWLYSYGNYVLGGTIYDNIWYMVTAVFSSTGLRAYIDGVLVASNTTPFAPPGVNGTPLYIGTVFPSAEHIKAYISNVIIYNRALSDDEVLQNYYAGLQRLTLKTNLFAWYDARDTNTQVITPTIANDTSGFNNGVGNPGTLYNGTSLNHRDGGISFSFDGVDDYIATTNGVGMGVYTICFWSKRELEDRMPIASNAGYDFYWYGDNSWKYRHGGVDGEFYYPKPTSIPINTWGFYCVVYDGSNVSIYRQGVYQGQQATTGSAFFNGFRIGSLGWGGYYYKGLISEVRFYYTFLTADRISTIYNSTKSRYGL